MSKYGIRLKWLAVTSFELQFGGTTIVTDPYITHCKGTDLTVDAVENCDIICLSHAHWDHITDIPALMDKFHPILMCGDQTALPMARWLGCSPTRVYPMYPDNELDFGDVKIRALYGRHTDLKKSLAQLNEQTGNRDVCKADPAIAALQEIGTMEYRNYLFTTPNGAKVLIWGNDPTVEQLNLCKSLAPDIVIMQRSNPLSAIVKKAEFAAQLGCKVLLPHHHDFWEVDDPKAVNAFEEEFLKRAPNAVFIKPRHGEWIEL